MLLLYGPCSTMIYLAPPPGNHYFFDRPLPLKGSFIRTASPTLSALSLGLLLIANDTNSSLLEPPPCLIPVGTCLIVSFTSPPLQYSAFTRWLPFQAGPVGPLLSKRLNGPFSDDLTAATFSPLFPFPFMLPSCLLYFFLCRLISAAAREK